MSRKLGVKAPRLGCPLFLMTATQANNSSNSHLRSDYPRLFFTPFELL